MGLPTSFSTFHKLLDGKDKKTQQAFSQFKLTAIILCDPDDTAFYAEVKRTFAALDYMTGAYLLFILFSDGVGEENIIPEDYTPIIFINDFELHERVKSLNYNKTLSKQEMLQLAKKFNIPAKKLPAIIVTNDLCSREGLVLKTTKDDFFDQLLLLAGYAAKHDSPIALNEIDLGKFRARSREEHFQYLIARELEDLFCKMQLRQEPNDTVAQRYCLSRLHDIISSLKHLNSNNDITDKFDELMDDYSSFRLAGHNQLVMTGTDSHFIDKDQLNGAEETTLNTLDTYNRILALADDNHPFDYLYLANGIGRMFETEINLSVVQQMRKTKGIPMPSYFNRFYMSKQNFRIITYRDSNNENDRYVDLNMRDKNYDIYDEVWRAPNLGESLAAYKKMKEDNSNSLYSIDTECWGNIANDRNKGSHTSVSDDESKRRFVDSYQHFKEFLDRDYFVELMDIKKELSGSN